ncbi:MAG: LuxR C-terminal-related transcriptional regulator, partial [Anaerolineales bacterium]
EYNRGTAFHFMGIHAYGGLADLSLQQGDLGQAAEYWNQALAVSKEPESWGAIHMPIIGWAYIRLAEIKYERNLLEEAESNLEIGLERAQMGGDVKATIAGHLLLGRISLARGQIGMAKQSLEQVRAGLEKTQLPEWTSRFERFQMDLWLAQGELAEANHWIETQMDLMELGKRPEQEEVRLGATRVLLARSNKADTEQALTILQDMQNSAAEEGRRGLELQSLAQLALGQWQSRQETKAMTSLEKALRLARVHGHMRSFIDLGPSMARLLQEAEARDVAPEQVQGLLEIFEAEMALSPARPPLTEPLTDRELEVLELMAAGLTNKEIGEQLVISPGTVKKHAANIYGKLEVGGRTEAAARARQLSLLD